MPEVLNATKRDDLGSRACKRLRRDGQVPAVMYGHGEANVNLSLSASEVSSAIRHGSKLVEITGDVSDSVLLREIQWDALGVEILHLDLTRVSAEETVQIDVGIELRGEAPGTKEGGVVAHPRHSITILCPAGAIPDKLQISINDLQLGQSINAASIALPEGASLVTDAEAIIVQCVEAAAEQDEEAPGAADLAEPEVIGRAADEGEDAGE